MSPILKGVVASGISGHLTSPSDYESIQTITVGSGGLATASFTSIPSTYKHLEIRLWGYSTRSSGNGIDDYNIRMNGDTSGSYSNHSLFGYGGGTTPAYTNGANQTRINSPLCVGTLYSGAIANGGAIIQIPDYTNTNKVKTIKIIGGCDQNGVPAGSSEPRSGIASGTWQSGYAINQIDLYCSNGNWGQYTNIALYGIKG